MKDLKQKFSSLTKNLAQTSSGLLNATKISIQLANEEDKLKNVYIDIGKKVGEIYTFGGTLGACFDDKYTEIVVHEQKIKDLREALKRAKSTGHEAEVGPAPAASEPKPLETHILEKHLTAEETTPTALQTKICHTCGVSSGADQKFCPGCGRMF